MSEVDHRPFQPLPAGTTLYAALGLLPPDPKPPVEGDNALLADHPAGLPPEKLSHPSIVALLAHPKPPRKPVLVVRLLRELRRGLQGPDVFGLQRALQMAAVRSRKATGGYGAGTETEVATLQRKFGFKGADVDGVYGKKTHARLVASGAFDAYGASLMARAPHPDPRVAVANRIVAAFLDLYHYDRLTARVHYSMGADRMMIVRRHLVPPFSDDGDIYEDCSSTVTGCYDVGGAPDPNGSNFNGEGWTGTLNEHGAPVEEARTRPADLGLFGAAPSHHVILGLGEGRWGSHGWEGAPSVYDSPHYRPDPVHFRTYTLT